MPTRTEGGLRRGLSALLVVALSVAPGCAQLRGGGAAAPATVAESQKEELLLDVGIQSFDTGLDEDDSDARTFEEIRKAEAHFFAVQLKRTLEQTGEWGAVRVLPGPSENVDVVVSGEILHSDGERLELGVRARDARGQVWLQNRYDHSVEREAYLASTAGEVSEPFQPLYDEVALDLTAERARLAADELREIRRAAALRFASDLAPDAFVGYLHELPDGTVEVRRLPAREDPMMMRVERIRIRDRLLVDTLNEHYDAFHGSIESSYRQWRAMSYDELLALRSVQQKSNLRTALGAVAVVGGVVLLAVTYGAAAQIVGPLLTVGGVSAVQSGLGMRAEATIHVEAMRELGESFESEVAPLVVEVEGRTLSLTGSAQAQYETWQRLLRQLYREESGLPIGPDVPDPLASESDSGTTGG